MAHDFPHMTSERLLIGALESSDREAFAAYRNLPEVARYQSWENFSLSEADALIAYMKKTVPGQLDEWYQFAVRLKEDGSLIGDIGFKRSACGPSFEAQIGYSLAPPYQRYGYMREALQVLISEAEKDFNIRRFTASVDPRNTASIRLLESLAFAKEAHFRRNVWFKGSWADDAIYVLLRERT